MVKPEFLCGSKKSQAESSEQLIHNECVAFAVLWGLLQVLA